MLIGKDVTKIYNTQKKLIPILVNVSFTIPKNDFVFLTGKSGAGKTTLLKLIILEEYPTKGKILFNNIDITQIPPKLIPQYRRNIGIIFQDYKLLEYKTVYENLAFVLEILNKSKKEIQKTVDYLLDLVDLKEQADLFPRQLSGGEKRRVTIARALTNNPSLVIADEPTGDLDPENAAIIVKTLKTINEAGTTIIMTTHNFEIIRQNSDATIWELKDGVLITDRKVEEILSTKKNEHLLKSLKFLNTLRDDIDESIIDKLIPIQPTNIKQLLGLTPKFLNENLKLSKKEIKILTNKLKALLKNELKETD